MIMQEEWTQKNYDEIAGRIAQTITIRSYNKSGSYDMERKTTKKEYDIIFNIVKGMCCSYGWYSSKDAAERKAIVDVICDMAEFTLMQFIPNCNTYDTVYIPFKKEVDVW